MIRWAMLAMAAAVFTSSPLFTGCHEKRIERSAAEEDKDRKLVETVTASFASSPSFKFPDVQVASFKGTIQLSGFVVSEDQKSAAEKIAKSVSGVESVENKISLKR